MDGTPQCSMKQSNAFRGSARQCSVSGCCRCQAGWYLVCWLLVVLSGRLRRELRGTRSSLHRPNTSSLLDAAGLSARTSPMLKSIGMRRPLSAAAFCCRPLTNRWTPGDRQTARSILVKTGGCGIRNEIAYLRPRSTNGPGSPGTLLEGRPDVLLLSAHTDCATQTRKRG